MVQKDSSIFTLCVRLLNVLNHLFVSVIACRNGLTYLILDIDFHAVIFREFEVIKFICRYLLVQQESKTVYLLPSSAEYSTEEMFFNVEPLFRIFSGLFPVSCLKCTSEYRAEVNLTYISCLDC